MGSPEFDVRDDDVAFRVSTVHPVTLFSLCSKSIPHFIARYGRLHPDASWLSNFASHLSRIGISSCDVFVVLLLALMFTALRYSLQHATQNWVQRHHVNPLFAHKIGEATWKLLYYGLIWLYAAVLHAFVVDSFWDPLSIWDGFRSGAVPDTPTSVTLLYAVQTGFYVHSVWATVYMDQWRQDSLIMLAHHFIAVFLLAVSYADGYTLPGALVFVLQDNSDALLEIAKLCVYLKKRTNGDYYPVLALAGKIVLQSFAVVWIIFRLYWYPCKLLYATIYGGVYFGPQDSPAFPAIGAMLILLYLLNLFWFNFIARMCIRVLRTGEDPVDNREYDTSAVNDKPTKTRLSPSSQKSKEKNA